MKKVTKTDIYVVFIAGVLCTVVLYLFITDMNSLLNDKIDHRINLSSTNQIQSCTRCYPQIQYEQQHHCQKCESQQ